MNQTLSRKPVSSQASHLRFTTRELVLGGMFAALMAVISQLSIPMPNGVPITIQVFGIALIGITLGWRLGCLSAVIYLLIGAVGLPVFANFGGGFPSGKPDRRLSLVLSSDGCTLRNPSKHRQSEKGYRSDSPLLSCRTASR